MGEIKSLVHVNSFPFRGYLNTKFLRILKFKLERDRKGSIHIHL